MRKSSKSSKGSPKSEPAPGAPASVGADDVKVKAVNEMMERIKHGVVLRPVKGQATKETVKKSPSRGFPEVAPTKKDSELEVILRRRRKQNCDPSSGDVKGGEMSKVSSSESLNARNSLDSSKETVQSCHGGSTRSSLSEKGSDGGTNDCCDSCEDGERTHSAGKCVQSNGISMDLPSHGKHSTKTPGFPVSSDPVNTSTDAEC
ncbi:Shootin-1 [Acipenser ruthenus]|uniref:Shootin-1 n=1 Tax=Acipenser ruthenus TaxID=7906 RepID=A0A444UV80_ACIRT|nr:Shootin-1 [Acipenser ruthenus]